MKFVIIDLRTEKKTKIDLLKRHKVIDINHKISKEALVKILFH